MQQGQILHLNQDYWAKFIKKGALDKDALAQAGYDGKGQPEWIEAEMKKLGWIEGGEEQPFVGDPAIIPTPVPLSEKKAAEAAAAEAAKAPAKKAKKDDATA